MLDTLYPPTLHWSGGKLTATRSAPGLPACKHTSTDTRLCLQADTAPLRYACSGRAVPNRVPCALLHARHSNRVSRSPLPGLHRQLHDSSMQLLQGAAQAMQQVLCLKDLCIHKTPAQFAVVYAHEQLPSSRCWQVSSQSIKHNCLLFVCCTRTPPADGRLLAQPPAAG